MGARAHALGRWLTMMGLVSGAGLVAASCGGSGTAESALDASTFDGSGGPSFGTDSGANDSARCTAARTCASAGYTCGTNADGCGGKIECGACSGIDVCGVGGFSQCGDPTIGPDGGPTCVKKTCTDLGYDCGSAGDGCGGSIGPCGTCPGGQVCGAGGPNKCGAPTSADGGPQTSCTPATCASKGFNCGMAGDGCGGTIGPCGAACTAPLACGAGGQANVCGTSIACTGLCQQQAACDAGTTTISGTVRAALQESMGQSWNPSTPDPIPNVTVYIPQSAPTPFDADPNNPHVQCSQCGADVSGNPLVIATTGYDGKFVLKNVPVSKNASDKIPVVIQLGRWRRQFSFTVSNACGDNPVGDLNMPSKSTEGDIPLTAISTGSYDSIECVLLKMGVAQEEFTSYGTWKNVAASGTTPKPGRVHIYTSGAPASTDGFSRGPGAQLQPRQDETVLLGDPNTAAGPTNGTYMMYDQLLLPCWGEEFTAYKSAPELANLGYYGDHGGHFFATHYSYAWMNTNAFSSLSTVANWDVKANQNLVNTAFKGSVSANVPTSNPGLFVQWLNLVGALDGANPAGSPPANPTVTLQQARHDVDSVASGSTEWIDGTDPAPRTGASSSTMLLHFTFDMPVGHSSQCGHVIYSDFHVNGSVSNGATFPSECVAGSLTAQERILEYMIWDLASCVPGPPTSTCTPKSCKDQGIECGPAGDTCGNLIAGGCGSCATGQTCGGGGVAGKCAPPSTGCVPKSCDDQGIHCGEAGDTCGNLIAGGCGKCMPPQTCGGGGVQGTCGGTSGCHPQTCADQGIQCGPTGDGCGGVIASCGECTAPETCGGAGVAGQCGAFIAK